MRNGSFLGNVLLAAALAFFWATSLPAQVPSGSSVETGESSSSAQDLTIVMPTIQAKFGRAGYNCSYGNMSGILVLVPSQYALFDANGEYSAPLVSNLRDRNRNSEIARTI